ncbi:MAG: DUF3179 domain-containing protein [Fuerstiella sp.]|nr:DUF3179 domain-containing protein [Fuerstiella sp.]MCP4854633.1 DUF3179 domain-containing protein [Fuerstiella sp.]
MNRLSIVLCLALVAVLGCNNETENLGRDEADDIMLNAAMQDTPFMSEGIQRPEIVDAGSAGFSEEERVIGVVAGDEARAYSIKSMSGMSSHVVNDVIGTTPVSMTYCDRTDCVRVFTGGTPGKPISLSVGGFSDGEMLIMFQDQTYKQSSQEIPLKEYESEITTWKDWLARYPETKVFTDATSPGESVDTTPPN